MLDILNPKFELSEDFFLEIQDVLDGYEKSVIINDKEKLKEIENYISFTNSNTLRENEYELVITNVPEKSDYIRIERWKRIKSYHEKLKAMLEEIIEAEKDRGISDPEKSAEIILIDQVKSAASSFEY